MFEIISFSDPSTLSMVFNAIASIFGADSYSSASILVSVAMLMVFSVSTLSSGQREIPFLKWFVGLIVFALGFMTTVDVSIVDSRTERTTLVSNVPIAIAAPASVISSIGYRFTEMTETAFGNVDGQRITTSGYLSPLVMMAYYRDNIENSSCFGGNDDSFIANGIKVCPTYRNYARDCTAVKYSRGDGEGIALSAVRALDVVFFGSDSHSTILVNADGSTREDTCRDAWPIISKAMSRSNLARATNNLRGMLGDSEGAEPVLDQIDESLRAITNRSVSSRELTLALYTKNVVKNATQSYLLKHNEPGMAENFATSTYMRNYGWALQGSLWLDIVDSFLRLMETVIYSIAPFIGLLILTGPAGFKTFVMYAQILIVLQLIPIMLVVVQNIILVEAQRIHDSMLGAYSNVYSMEMVYRFVREMDELAGLGGMLAATVVPALALALVTGSTFALSGALRSAAEPGKDTDAAPNQVKQGDFIDDLSNQTTTQLIGGYNYTADQGKYLPRIAENEALGLMIKGSEILNQTNKEELSRAMSSVKGDEVGESFTKQDVQEYSKLISKKSSSSDAIISNMLDTASKSKTISEEEASQFASTMGLLLGTSGKFGDIFKAIGISGGWSWSNTEVNKEILSELNNSEQGRSLIKQYNDILQKGEDLLEGDSENNSESDGYLERRSKDVQDAKSKLESSSKELSKAKELQRKLQVSTPDENWIMYQNFAKDSFIQDNLNKVYDFIDDKKESGDYTDEELANRFFDNFNTAYRGLDSPLSNISDEQIFTGAMFNAMSMTKGLDPSLFAFALTGDESYLDIKSGIGGFESDEVNKINNGLHDKSGIAEGVAEQVRIEMKDFNVENKVPDVDHPKFRELMNAEQKLREERERKINDLSQLYPDVESLRNENPNMSDSRFSSLLVSLFDKQFNSVNKEFVSQKQQLKDLLDDESLWVVQNYDLVLSARDGKPNDKTLMRGDPLENATEILSKASLISVEDGFLGSVANGDIQIDKIFVQRLIDGLDGAQKLHESSYTIEANKFVEKNMVSSVPKIE